MDRLAKEGLLGQIEKVNLSTCENCLAGKMARKPFGKRTRAELPLQLIHSDICGPMNVRAQCRGVYFIIFIDDYTRFGHVCFISHKFIENQLDKRIKILRNDRGHEYLSDEFKQLWD